MAICKICGKPMAVKGDNVSLIGPTCLHRINHSGVDREIESGKEKKEITHKLRFMAIYSQEKEKSYFEAVAKMEEFLDRSMTDKPEKYSRFPFSLVLELHNKKYVPDNNKEFVDALAIFPSRFLTTKLRECKFSKEKIKVLGKSFETEYQDED